MDYTPQLSGKAPDILVLTTPITQADALDGTGDVVHLNMVFISEANVVGSTQKISAMNVNGVIPVLYTPNNNDPSQDYYYDGNDLDISPTYGDYHKIHEAHIPYIHGQLINHGFLPFNVYQTLNRALEVENTSDDTEIVSALNASSLINNIGRVLVTDTDNGLQLLGYSKNENNTFTIDVLSSFSFTEGGATAINDWEQAISVE